ncbi:hypothetical protein [Streptomyces sp. NPDC088915]|uniref:hypothetical protein n=1 Tax=Streptomyces sp. NPDC088915 TaxID=3365912 RepID=UPI003819914E
MAHPDGRRLQRVGVPGQALGVGGSIGLAVLLVPLTSGDGETAGTISAVFGRASGPTALALLAAALCWYGPGARRTAAARD